MVFYNWKNILVFGIIYHTSLYQLQPSLQLGQPDYIGNDNLPIKGHYIQNSPGGPQNYIASKYNNNNNNNPDKNSQMQNKLGLNPKLQDIVQMSMHNLVANSKSNTKFIIRYEEKQAHVVKSVSKVNRYSSKHEHQIIRNKKISESVLEKTRPHRNSDESGLPSYLRPTEASISAQLQRNKISSLAELNQNKNGANIKLRSKSLEGEEERDAEREYNRVPIQFYDEKNYGCGADFLRARVVFRGYAPKNTYYYLKTLKPFRRKPKRSGHVLFQSPSFSLQQPNLSKGHISSIVTLNVMKNDFDLRFESKFQSGNLSAASRINTNEYWLYMRQDTNTHGLRQWYYFAVMNKKPIRVKFRMYKFTKSYSLYKMGMRPYIRTGAFDANGNNVASEWHQGCQKVKYEYDNVQRCFYLQFQYYFEQENQQVQFSMLPPYTYSMLKDYIRNLQTFQESQPQKQPQNGRKFVIQVQTIGQTLAGLDIPFIEMRKKLDKNEFYGKAREAIVVLARTHPGQTVSNFSLQTFIDTIIHSDDIIEHFDFFILPMVNPDGVYFGNHRTSIIGQDLNRNFNTNDFQVFPQIEAAHNAINKARRTHKIRFLIDLHGHSARKNIFAYGEQDQINTSPYLHTRILPKLLNDSISSFKYDYCVFREAKQKKNTARVYYTNKYKINCLTIQQSYGIVDDGAMGVHVWRNFGAALANSLLQFAKLYNEGREKALEEFLVAETEKQKLALEKRIQKHKKMLGLDDNRLVNMYSTTMGKNHKDKVQHTQEVYKKNEQVHDDWKQKAVELEIIQAGDSQQLQKDQQQLDKKQQEEQQQKSIGSSELSSGDQSFQLMADQVEVIKKDIIRIGCLRQGLKREKYNIADKKLQLYQSNQYQHRQEQTTRRLHEQKSSMIPRIAKLQLKRKQEYNLSMKRDFKQDRRGDVIQRERLERRKEIEAKFKRMELPVIRK